MWKCPQHGFGNVEIIIPTPLVLSYQVVAGKLCSIYYNPIQSRYAQLAYHCDDPSCAVCHLSATCSGFVNPRGTTRHAYFLLEFGAVIYTLHEQQMGIHQLINSTLPLHVSPYRD